MRGNRAVGIALVVVLAVATPAAAGSGSEGAPPSMAETFIDLVRDAWNEDPALVVLRARDKGYDLEQTFEGINGEEQILAEDGTITEQGRPVPPADPPAGVLAREGEAKVAGAVAATGKALAKPKAINPPKELLDDGTFVLIILLGLMAEGYTTEQIIVDGILAGGIDAVPFAPIRIIDDNGRAIEPGDEPVEPAAETIITDMVAIVEGYDPQDPPYKARYDVRYAADLAIGDATADVDAKGTLGTDPSGRVYLGRMKGKMAIPAFRKCAAETVLVVITLRGEVPKSGQPTELSQSWSYRSSTGGGGEGFCITIAEAPELVELVPANIGSFRGTVAPGATLKSERQNATLSIAAKG